MESKKIALTERPLFVGSLTFLGGFCNAYTFVTRDGAMSNMHTGNMSRLGISLANGDWAAAGKYFLPILACVLGAAAGEALKAKHSKERNWRVTALVVLAAMLAVVGVMPASVPNIVVTNAMSFVTGFLFTLFRTTQWGAFSATVCTGNLRSVGQYLFGALNERTAAAWTRLAVFSAVTFAFVVGVFVGVHVSNALATFAIIAAAAIPVALAVAIAKDSRAAVQKA